VKQVILYAALLILFCQAPFADALLKIPADPVIAKEFPGFRSPISEDSQCQGTNIQYQVS